MDDKRVIALNEYVKKLEQEIRDQHIQIINQCEYIVEQDLRRKRFYERIAKGHKVDPISMTEAEEYIDKINSSITGMHQTILKHKEKLSEQRNMGQA